MTFDPDATIDAHRSAGEVMGILNGRRYAENVAFNRAYRAAFDAQMIACDVLSEEELGLADFFNTGDMTEQVLGEALRDERSEADEPCPTCHANTYADGTVNHAGWCGIKPAVAEPVNLTERPEDTIRRYARQMEQIDTILFHTIGRSYASYVPEGVKRMANLLEETRARVAIRDLLDNHRDGQHSTIEAFDPSCLECEIYRLQFEFDRMAPVVDAAKAVVHEIRSVRVPLSDEAKALLAAVAALATDPPAPSDVDAKAEVLADAGSHDVCA